jgi:hypothetical protein
MIMHLVTRVLIVEIQWFIMPDPAACDPTYL